MSEPSQPQQPTPKPSKASTTPPQSEKSPTQQLLIAINSAFSKEIQALVKALPATVAEALKDKDLQASLAGSIREAMGVDLKSVPANLPPSEHIWLDTNDFALVFNITVVDKDRNIRAAVRGSATLPEIVSPDNIPASLDAFMQVLDSQINKPLGNRMLKVLMDIVEKIEQERAASQPQVRNDMLAPPGFEPPPMATAFQEPPPLPSPNNAPTPEG
jgi:hypothetical protein